MTKPSRTNEELVAAHRAGDRTALAQLVEQNEPLVFKELRRTQRLLRDSREDLAQEGRLAILRAVAKFDPSRGLKFSTYVVQWIRGMQRHYVTENLRLYRVATTHAQKKVLLRGARARARLEAAGLPADDDSVARELAVRVEDVAEVQARLQPHLNFDALAEMENDDASHPEGDGAPRSPDSLQGIPARLSQWNDTGNPRADEQAEMLARFRLTLDWRDRFIFDHRLNPETIVMHTTLLQVGKRIGRSRERVRQIEADMIDQLRGMMKVA